MSVCPKCGAETRWVFSEVHERPMPIDPVPYDGGDPQVFILRLLERGSRFPVWQAIPVPPDAFPGEPLYRSHGHTCPNGYRRSEDE